MKILKYLFFLLLIAIVACAIYFGTKDGSFDVAETRVINAPASVVYDNVKDFKDWKNWGPWMDNDSTMQVTYAEKTEGEGASYSWTSEEEGDGSMTTTKVIPGKELEQDITFKVPVLGESQSKVYWKFEDTDAPGQSKVTWGMKGEQSLMEKIFFGLFSEKELEPELRKMYQQGLTKLDSVAVASTKVYNINVDGITKHGGGYYMYVTTSAPIQDVGTKMGGMMAQVMGYMEQNKIAMNGMPFTLYNMVDEANNSVIFSACIPVRERVITPSGSPAACGFMKPVTALKTTLRGDYSNLSEAYAKGQQYIHDTNLIPHPEAQLFEVYTTDPGEVPNPADYVTEVYMPVLVPSESDN